MSTLAFVTALTVLFGCASNESLRDQFLRQDFKRSFNERIRFEATAPLIVVGQVLKVEDVGSPQRAIDDHRVGVQLTRITVNVEETIKGTIKSGPLSFFYFRYSPDTSEIDLGARRYIPDVGQRRMFFLKPAGSMYRMIGDVLDYTLPVNTGSHSGELCTGQSPGCCIARILLIPHPDVETQWYLVNLIQSEAVAEILCSRQATEELMRSLTQHSDQRIANGAREVIEERTGLR
jgi:hypothetical protein